MVSVPFAAPRAFVRDNRKRGIFLDPNYRPGRTT